MLRLLHTADVLLGARHADLGDRAATQRERQFAAFTASIDLALAEKVDLVLIAGDLFDSNVQPRRSVERAATQLKRLVDATYTERVFGGAEITPLRTLEPNLHILGLSNGPTLAFKDVAMQLISRLMDHVLAKRAQRTTIVVATSGDTGGALSKIVRWPGVRKRQQAAKPVRSSARVLKANW